MLGLQGLQSAAATPKSYRFIGLAEEKTVRRFGVVQQQAQQQQAQQQQPQQSQLQREAQATPSDAAVTAKPTTVAISETQMSWRDAIDAMRGSKDFRRQLTLTLSSVPFSAIFWESIPFNVQNVTQRPFEFVAVDASRSFADMDPDPSAFREHMKSKDKNWLMSARFLNLGGDAMLISPKPVASAPHSTYTHLSSFLRHAPSEQCDEFWRNVGEALESEIVRKKEIPIWCSTSGLGVAWLHVRLDSRPKYYQYSKYKQWP